MVRLWKASHLGFQFLSWGNSVFCPEENVVWAGFYEWWWGEGDFPNRSEEGHKCPCFGPRKPWRSLPVGKREIREEILETFGKKWQVKDGQTGGSISHDGHMDRKSVGTERGILDEESPIGSSPWAMGKCFSFVWMIFRWNRHLCPLGSSFSLTLAAWNG